MQVVAENEETDSSFVYRLRAVLVVACTSEHHRAAIFLERFELSLWTGKGADKTRSWRQRAEEPKSGRMRVAVDTYQLRRLPGRQRDFNLRQGIGDAFAGRFQIGFLSRPAIEKCFESLFRRHSSEHRVF